MRPKIKIFSSAAGYDLAAGDYDKKVKYLDSFEQGRLLPLFGDLSGRSALDAGAGTGRLSVRLAHLGATVTALDVSPAMLRILRRKNRNIRTTVGDMERMPFPDSSFDYVVAAFTLVHLFDPAVFFDEAYRVLKEGGRLMVTNINQKRAPEIKTAPGKIKIESFYHRPEKIRELLEGMAFAVKKEILVKEGGKWINQILVAEK